jgi:flagellar hook-associated protein 3 FlgL
MYRTVTLAEEGASETNEGQGRDTIADEIEEIRDSIISISNTEVMGRFLFAGTDCNTLPFEKDQNQAVPDTVLYNGNSDDMLIQADFSVQVEVNIPGSEVFGVGPFAPAGSTDIFQRLAELRDALIADDTTAIANSIGNFHEIINQINEAMGRVGNRMRHLQETTGMLKDFKTSLIQKMSSMEDADMAKAISDLKSEEVGLQATLQTGARINNISLINFLR